MSNQKQVVWVALNPYYSGEYTKLIQDGLGPYIQLEDVSTLPMQELVGRSKPDLLIANSQTGKPEWYQKVGFPEERVFLLSSDGQAVEGRENAHWNDFTKDGLEGLNKFVVKVRNRLDSFGFVEGNQAERR